ncbi:MAG: S8 family serine peptidase, partial [Actinobacteria bacterium]|nr:S8 family serine peptidase [Actinomycetota bacterium]
MIRSRGAIRPLLLAAIIAVSGAGSAAPAAATDLPAAPRPAGTPVPGELLVRWEPTATRAAKAATQRRHGIGSRRHLPLAGVEVVTIDPGEDEQKVAEDLTRERSVAWAEVNQRWQPLAQSATDRQWALDAVRARLARPAQPTAEGIVVAVIDTGIEISHPDLANRIWVNRGEIPGNGVDDEGNGYVDDVNGWDFFHGDASVFDESDGDTHGTHVAGVIAAARDDGVGVDGLGDARIMPLKFLGPHGGTTEGAIGAVDYAIKMGARVTNNSWGGAGYSQALADKISEAEAAGQVFVAAAGNEKTDIDDKPMYPASYALDNVVAVAATNAKHELPLWSNVGRRTVDLAAPGADIWSSMPRLAKAVASGPETGAGPGRTLFHSFGLEGMAAGDRTALLGAALRWAGAGSGSKVLLVDDDGGAPTETAYTDVLGALGMSTTTTTVPKDGCASGPGAARMNAVQVVVWTAGPAYECTLTADDQLNLGSYVAGGGTVLLFGVDVAYDLTQQGTVPNAFLRAVLRAGFVDDSDGNLQVDGQSNTAYAGTVRRTLTSGWQSPGQSWSDALLALSGGVAALRTAEAASMSGTSMAAPHVTAAIAAVLAAYPEESSTKAVHRVVSTGIPETSLASTTISGKRLDLAAALDGAGPPAAVSMALSGSTLTWNMAEPAAITVDVTRDGTTVRTVQLGARPAGTHGLRVDTTPAGNYQIRLTATDAVGTSTATSV